MMRIMMMMMRRRRRLMMMIMMMAMVMVMMMYGDPTAHDGVSHFVTITYNSSAAVLSITSHVFRLLLEAGAALHPPTSPGTAATAASSVSCLRWSALS